MKSMLHSLNIAPALVRLKNATGNRAGGSVWTVDGGAAQITAGVAMRDLLLVPAEDVLTLAVALPLPSHARRLAALPFAIEDRITDRIDAVHLALGAQRIGGNWIAGVIDPAKMQNWLIAAEEAGLGDAAIMPDALALPLPGESRWNVLRQAGGRILARLPDGTGFAAQQPLFLAIWGAAGKPECDELTGFEPITPIDLDLRQGLFARPRQGLSTTARRVAIVAAAGLLAHGAIAAADTIALRSIAAKRGNELIAALNTAAPGRFTASDPHDAAVLAAELLPAGTNAPPGSLVPLLVRTSNALAPFGNLLTMQGLEFDEGQRRLLIDTSLADPSAAPSIVDALRKAGLTARFEGARLTISAGGET